MEKPEETQQVFLGYLSDYVPASEDSTDVYNPKVGGHPAWIHEPFPVPPCSICGSPLRLLVQSFDPLDEFAVLERVIYLFACNKSKCSNATGWFTLRGQRLAPGASESASVAAPVTPSATTTAPSSKPPAAAALFSTGWGDDEEEATAEPAPDLDALLRMRDLTIKAPAEATKKTAPPPPLPPPPQEEVLDTINEPVRGDVFPAFYLEIAAEPPAKKRPKEDEELLNVEETLPAEAGETWADEGYEVSENDLLLKFQRRLERSPEQVIRYSYRGKPRWIAPMNTPIPPCSRCGATRVFEFQVMPPLVYFLECGPEELDFGTAAVFVCSKSCGGAGNFVEHVVTQAW